ncbi:hypothetical protein E4L95_15570 [Paracoccus liaowanqingii]|uniref:Flagellar biosynthesis protein FlgL n=1 Tax=Paracoccus liaowanqingii TaxID=2560053 RepID=A0A4Z1CFD0_9RHOB|nr:hypothetical protein [Paracoccus liaowanqingii]TGN54323.1 hypothetical protein E4L95_15570 [Paracoccus liaowanqingii]
MTLNSIGDQARAYALQTASTRTRTTLATLTEELATGQVADLGQRLDGNTRALNEIKNRIAMTHQLSQNGREADIRLQAVQDMFDGIRAETRDLGIALATDPFLGDPLLPDTRASDVANALDAVVRRLNGMNSSRYLMAGEAADTVPLSSPAAMLDRLEVLTAGLTTAADVAQVISDWFDAPAGAGSFLDEAYHGTLGPAQRVAVSDTIAVEMATTAASPAIRDLLKGLATTAIVARGVLDGAPDQRRQLLALGGNVMVSADTAVLGEMGRVGQAQQTVERALVVNGASLTTLERGRGDLLRADPMETTAALTEVQYQLEAIYAVTARLSKLRLTEFLR